MSSHKEEDILKGFQIYNEGVEIGLSKQGWKQQNERPTDKEFFELGEKYWVQDEVIHELMTINLSSDKTKKQEINSRTCSKCGKDMVLRRTCKSCEEFRRGFKSEWLCSCGFSEFSKKTVAEWEKELSKNKNDILNDSTSLIQVNSISSPKEKKEKGLIKKFFEFVKVSIGPKVVESVFQKRYSICKACKFHIVKGERIFCKPCGCPTWEPAQLENKLRFARLSCPKEFFKAIDETTQKELLL